MKKLLLLTIILSASSFCQANRLSTGKKVNSAIDHPSSYYTASSLRTAEKSQSNRVFYFFTKWFKR